MDDRGFESINVIPFIDIMLVLLTIVLTTSTFIATGAIGVNLPQANQTTAPPNVCLTIEIDQAGRISLDGNRARLDQMAGLLENRNRESGILVRADRQLPLQLFVDVMDRLKQLGFNKISLQAETWQ